MRFANREAINLPLAVVSEMATEKGFKISDPSFGWYLQDFTQDEDQDQKNKPHDFCIETCRIVGIEVTKEILETSLQSDIFEKMFDSELQSLLFESQETIELKLRKKVAEYIQPDSLEGEILLMLFDKKNYWRCKESNQELSLGALNKNWMVRKRDNDHTFKSDRAEILFQKIRTIQKRLCEVRRGIQFVKMGLIEEDKRISTLILQCHQIQSEQRQTAYLDDILSLLDNNMDKLNFHHKWPFKIGTNNNGTKNLII